MLKKKFRRLLIISLAIAILIPTQISLVNSSAGAIRINRTTASVPNQQVNAGENVNLYFGDQGIMWSGNQFYLLLSHDLSTTISSGDYIYSPKFSVANLQNPSTPTDYSNGDGFWTIGNNWVNGTFAINMPAGSYSVKAFDFGEAGSETDTGSVAVTDTFIIVNPLSYETTFQISPSSGPGGVNAQFSGSGYHSYTTIDIAYYDPVYSEYRAWRTATTDAYGNFAFTAEVPDLGKSNYQGDNPETYNRLQYKTQYQGLAYSFATYNQYARGLKSIGGQTAYGLYGNSSNLVSTVKAEAGEAITISGKWFHPGAIYILLDSEATVGSVTRSQWNNAIPIGNTVANSQGAFEATATIPNDIDGGEHYIAVEDSENTIIVKILITSGTLQISPASGPGGANIQFSGTGYPASSPVSISYRDNQYSSWNYWTTLNSDLAGNINLNVEIPDLGRSCYSGDSYNTSTMISFRSDVNGRIYAYADYTQNARGLKQVGAKTAAYLYGDQTNFANYNLEMRSGDAMTISGRNFHPGIVYIRWDGNKIVGSIVGTSSANNWSSASIIGESIANSAGSFDAIVTIPTAEAGNYWVAIEDSQTSLIIQIPVVTSSTPTPTPTPTVTPTPTPSSTPSPTDFFGGPTPTPTTTPTPAPTPTPTPTPSSNKPAPTITVACKSTPTDNGFKVEISGLLASNGAGLADKAVQLYYSNNGGANWESLTRVNSGINGKFSAVWISSASGNFMLKAVSEGNTDYNQGTTQVNFVISETPDKNVLSVTSNSTITQFKFDSETNQISFKAEGASHTNGYVAINVPKTLVDDVSNLKVYLDGSEVTFNSELQIDTWVITIHYSHSVHTIVMDLSGTSNVDNQPSELPTYTVAIAIAAIVIIAIVAVAVLKKKQKTNN